MTPSPCIGVCRLDQSAVYCLGCLRSLSEIASWPRMPEVEKLRILVVLDERKNARSVPAEKSQGLLTSVPAGFKGRIASD